MTTQREKLIQQYTEAHQSYRGPDPFVMPELELPEQLISQVRLNVEDLKMGRNVKDFPHGVFFHTPDLAGFRGKPGCRYWTSVYLDLLPVPQLMIENSCSEGHLAALELIPWGGEYEGYGLLKGTDGNHIANPFISLVPVNDWVHELRQTVEHQWEDWAQQHPAVAS